MPKSRYFPRHKKRGRASSSHGYYSTTRAGQSQKTGWDLYTKIQLQDLCRDRQLIMTGSKIELVNRLQEFLATQNEEAAAIAAAEKKKKAELEADAAMVDALEWVEQNKKNNGFSLSQSSMSSSQSSASSPQKSTLSQEQKDMIERKRQAALLKRQLSLNSNNSATLSHSSNTSSPTKARAIKFKRSDSVFSSPFVNPYSKISSPSPRRHFSSPRRLFQSNQSQAVLPPLPPDAPPIRQYSVDNLSDMQLKVVEAARSPTATSLSAQNEVGMGNMSGSYHPIVRVTAAAGTGKTTTLLHLALRCIDLNHKLVTYVTFSKASAVDAEERIQALLPPDKKSLIQASTLHSCAMRILSNQPVENEPNEMGNLVHDDKFRKLIEKVCGRSIDNYLHRAYEHMRAVSKTKKEESRKMKKAYDQCLFWLAKSFNSFCIKDMSLEKLKDETNAFRHYYPLKISAFRPGKVADKLGFPLAFYSSEQSYKFFADQCVVLWEYITKNGIRTFDTEMKRAQLNGVRIPGSVLLVDECQDLDACQVDFIAKQLQYGTAIFFVGDAAQTLYSFRGAKSSNYMSLPNAIDMCLNKSWRFGPAIAQIANVSLFAKEFSPQTNDYLLKPNKQWIPYRIVGARGEEESSICRDSLIGKSEDIGTITIVARTNFALMLRAMEIMGLGFLADCKRDDSDSDEGSHYSSDAVDTDSADASSTVSEMSSSLKIKNQTDMPGSLKLNAVKKFHINGEGDLSGLKRWRRASKEIRHL